MRDLATKELNGYRWKDGLVLRERFDDLGRVSTQICAPKVVRNKIFILAHEKFGHQFRNKVVHHVQKGFYWPSLWKDASEHCRSCNICQRVTKRNPKSAPMVKI